jgi:hypothetical protein
MIESALRIANMFCGASEYIWELINTEHDPHIAHAACVAVGFCPNERLDATFDRAIAGLRQNVLSIMEGTCQNPKSAGKFWAYFQAKFEWFMGAYEWMAFTLAKLIEAGLGQLCDREVAEHAVEFFREHPIPVAARAIQEAIDGVRARANAIARDSVAVEQALSELTT